MGQENRELSPAEEKALADLRSAHAAMTTALDAIGKLPGHSANKLRYARDDVETGFAYGVSAVTRQAV